MQDFREIGFNSTIKEKDMKFTSKILTTALLCATAAVSLPSCMKDNKADEIFTGLVTVEPNESGTRFQLNDSTSLISTNFDYKGKRTVRGLLNFSIVENVENSRSMVNKYVKVYALDTILTKKPAVDCGVDNPRVYGKDQIAIVNDWVNSGEDGYLTLRFRIGISNLNSSHMISLVNLGKDMNGYNFEFRHAANGDGIGQLVDGIIAFDLNELAPVDRSPVKLNIKWEGFNGPENASVKLTFRKK